MMYKAFYIDNDLIRLKEHIDVFAGRMKKNKRDCEKYISL